MKRYLLAISILAAMITGAHAEPMVGKKLAVGPSGQPFCLEVADLKEFVTAALTNDTTWVSAMVKEDKCGMLKKRHRLGRAGGRQQRR